MRILITGGAGFITSHLAEAELAQGNQVTSLDIVKPTKVYNLLNHKRFTYIQGSMLDTQIMEALVADCDLLYHFGAIADPKVYCTDPTRVMDVNVGGVKLACELAYKHGKKLVFASSSEIYGKNPNIPWREEHDSILGSGHLRWCYARTKLIGEDYCRAYALQGLRMSICRFFNIYGPRLDDIGQGRVMTCFLEGFLNNRPVLIAEPGNQTRCFTYISDAINGILLVAHHPDAEGKVFNVGVNTETTILELAYLMRNIGDFPDTITKVPTHQIYNEHYDDVFRRVPDNSRLKALGWEPRVNLREGLEHTINYFKERYAVPNL